MNSIPEEMVKNLDSIEKAMTTLEDAVDEFLEKQQHEQV
jgi:hypothetical protein